MQQGALWDAPQNKNTLYFLHRLSWGEVNCPISQNIKPSVENELIFQSATLGSLAGDRRSLDSHSLLGDYGIFFLSIIILAPLASHKSFKA